MTAIRRIGKGSGFGISTKAVIPRMQYAAASRIHLNGSGILVRPVKPGDDTRGCVTDSNFKQSNTVIASQRVGAKRRPMTGSAKQSISPRKERWIASSLTLLAMTVSHDFAFSPHASREVCS
jgi:hypothetical protein